VKLNEKQKAELYDEIKDMIQILSKDTKLSPYDRNIMKDVCYLFSVRENKMYERSN